MINHRLIRNLRWVRRFNFHSINHEQNVAEHSFFVGLLAYDLGLVFNGEMYAFRCMKTALYHDLEESVTSDIPFLVKRYLDTQFIERTARKMINIKDIHKDNFDDSILSIVRLADIVEMKLFLEEERRTGNMSLYEIEQEAFYLLVHSSAPKVCIDAAYELVQSIPQKPITDDLIHTWKFGV
jgi:5'-deoxynucleotidase YfbR-like HD superfamily hydrolase